MLESKAHLRQQIHFSLSFSGGKLWRRLYDEMIHKSLHVDYNPLNYVRARLWVSVCVFPFLTAPHTLARCTYSTETTHTYTLAFYCSWEICVISLHEINLSYDFYILWILLWFELHALSISLWSLLAGSRLSVRACDLPAILCVCAYDTHTDTHTPRN